MLKSFKHIIAVYLMLTVVFASVGFQVYMFFCECSHNGSVAVFESNHCCDANQHNTCSIPNIKNECCKKTSVFIKFTDQLFPTFKNISEKIVFVHSCKAFCCVLDEQKPETFSTDFYPDISEIPKLYGKTMVFRYHSIKIPAC